MTVTTTTKTTAVNGWKCAFTHAVSVEAEGAKHFEGFFKKNKVENKESASSNDNCSAVFDVNHSTRDTFRPTYKNPIEKEEETDERGGFCQPSGLADFVKIQQSNCSSLMTVTENDNANQNNLKKLSNNPIQTVSENIPQFETENGMARQICRAWLKNTFLQLGQPCKNQSCERRHIIESKSVGSLYKDYSFKGLTTAQRNSIISQVQANAASYLTSSIASTAATTTTTITSTTASIVTTDANHTAATTLDSIHPIQSTTLKSDTYSKSRAINIATSSSMSKNSKHPTTRVPNYCNNSVISVVDKMNHELNSSNIYNSNCSNNDSSNKRIKIVHENKSSLYEYVFDNSGDIRKKISLSELKRKRKPWMPIHKQIAY